jgi:hypothetical protein
MHGGGREHHDNPHVAFGTLEPGKRFGPMPPTNNGPPCSPTVALLYSIACVACTATSSIGLPSPPPGAFDVNIKVDAAHPTGILSRPWRYFGADEPNYATTDAGGKLLAEIGALAPGEVYLRAHNLLTSGDGRPALKWGSTNAYTELLGKPHYDWAVVDGVLRAGLSRGVRPLIEIGFMPEALSTSPGPISPPLAGGSLHRLDLPSQGLPPVGRAGVSVGQALRR